MTITIEDVIALEALEEKIKRILPPLYRDSYDVISPVSMGSAPLKYDMDGKVQWDEMWGSFCDLAMAGGPPHRGTLLQPASFEDIEADHHNYDQIVEEICRGISLVTGLPAERSMPGWIRVTCNSIGMAAWLVRAMVMENILVRHQQEMLFVPAGPSFRIGKEVKNVITAIAKTCHYWLEHTPPDQQQALHEMFSSAGNELIEPASPLEVARELDAYQKVVDGICRDIGESLALPCFTGRYVGWVGIECPSVRKAVWMIRAMIVENVVARREAELVFLPASPKFSTGGQYERLIRSFTHAYRLSIAGRI